MADVPEHLLRRSQERRKALGLPVEGADEGEAPAAEGVAPDAPEAPAAEEIPAAGGGGDGEEITESVGGIPAHLLAIELASILSLTAFVTIFSALVKAPLLGLADVNQTPNPSKAPWYFLGLQELLKMFHPMVAGVTIPGVALGVLAITPYVDKNPSNKPTDRKFAIIMMTIFLMMWAVLVIIGSFFRGEGFNFVFPWNKGIFFEL